MEPMGQSRDGAVPTVWRSLRMAHCLFQMMLAIASGGFAIPADKRTNSDLGSVEFHNAPQIRITDVNLSRTPYDGELHSPSRIRLLHARFRLSRGHIAAAECR